MNEISNKITIEIESKEVLDEIRYEFESSKMESFNDFMNMIFKSYFCNDLNADAHIIHLLNNLTNTAHIILSKTSK